MASENSSSTLSFNTMVHMVTITLSSTLSPLAQSSGSFAAMPKTL
jgi:hypothetical protein